MSKCVACGMGDGKLIITESASIHQTCISWLLYTYVNQQEEIEVLKQENQRLYDVMTKENKKSEDRITELEKELHSKPCED